MKTKILLTMAMAVCSVLIVQAQSKTGIKGGVNFTNLYVDNVDDENLKAGFNAGIYHKAALTDALALQPEVLYSSKGSSIHYDNILLGSGHYRYNLNYLEVPVLLMINLGTFHVAAGPYGGLLLGVNIKEVDDGGDVEVVESLDRDDFNTLDYGVAADAGFDFTGGTLGVRYSYGLQEIGKSIGPALENAKNSALQVYVGFDF